MSTPLTSDSRTSRRQHGARVRGLWVWLVTAAVLCTFGAAVVGLGHHFLSADHDTDDHECVVCKLQSSTLLASDLPDVQPSPPSVGEDQGTLALAPPVPAYLTGPPLRGPPTS